MKNNKPYLRISMTILLVSSIAACATKTVPPVIIGGNQSSSPATKPDVSPVSGKELEVQPKATVEIDEGLLLPCKALPMMNSTNPSPMQVLEHKAEEVKVYADCRNRYSRLVILVKKAFNIQD